MEQKLDVVKVWQDLHKTPELGFEEVKTSAYLAEALEKIGYEVHRGIAKTGVVGYKRTNVPGPVLMLRADMDALPFKNDDGTIERVHACGHDSHSAMLLTAAAYLFDKVKKGTLKIFFQPAEETIFGAQRSIDDGVIDDVDMALGLHIRPIQDLKAGDMCAAVRHSASTMVKILVHGRTAHASRPHLGVNCCEAAAAITQAVAAIKLNPAQTWSVKVTSIKCSSGAINIIPDEAELLVDCRAQTNPLMRELQEKLKAAATGGAASVGATAEVIELGSCPAAEYDEDLVAEVADVIKSVVGAEHLDKDCGGGGEDFHYFKQKKPAIKNVYFGVGVGCEPGLHNRNMHFDPQYLINGVKVLETMALKYIG